MTESIKRLEEENAAWLARWTKTNATVANVVQDRAVLTLVTM